MSILRVFFICVLVGVILGAIYGLINIVKAVFRNNFITNNIIDFLYSILFCLVSLYTLIQFNFGQVRLYLIVAFIFGFYLERKTLGKVFAKLEHWLYNKLGKLKIYLSKTKIYKKITK